MKTLITSLLVLASVSFSFSHPLPPEKNLEEIVYVKSKDQRFSLFVTEPVGKFVVSIFNEKGKLIDRVSFRANEAVSVPFNLTQVPEGEYSVKVQSKDVSIAFSISSKKPMEKQLIAYAKAVGSRKISLTVVGIEQPGTQVTFYDINTQREIKGDYVKQYAGFQRDYRLADTTVDKVYMKVKDVHGNTKTFYF
ncbi:hypothetical protein ADIS_1842 [Lunatimonas lonarensis]|uniref:Secretion system C-terminal sorting domain-containing protein n=1 Tax=Lunatimonas lonarensis TaxID=1232681 RepID=R7ZUB8_9BACT|nr:FlgD immunoglobulin-like domain containing protein [Lunatimonas lonarensis]EON77623.1 hypothetical protein ADIS_1842 [Lunatimonas lonarensis]